MRIKMFKQKRKTNLKDEDVKVDSQGVPLGPEVGVEVCAMVGADRHICEHAMELIRELIATGLLEPSDHAFLRIHGR